MTIEKRRVIMKRILLWNTDNSSVTNATYKRLKKINVKDITLQNQSSSKILINKNGIIIC